MFQCKYPHQTLLAGLARMATFPEAFLMIITLGTATIPVGLTIHIMQALVQMEALLFLRVKHSPKALGF